MALKDILLLLDAQAPCDGRLVFSIALAQHHAAALTALCLYADPAPTIAEGYAIGPEAAGAVIDRRAAEIAHAVDPVATRFQGELQGSVVEGLWAAPTSDRSPADLALRARAFDLAILGSGPSARALAEHVVLSGGAPCLLVGEDLPRAGSLDRILVAWDGGRAARRALHDSLPFLKQAKAVQLVAFGQDLPPHLGADEILRHLRLHGVEATFQHATPGHLDIGSALLRHARAFEAELLVLGAYGHTPTVEAIVGGVTRTVLAQAALPVLISH